MYRVFSIEKGFFIQETFLEDEFGQCSIKIFGEIASYNTPRIEGGCPLSVIVSGLVPVKVRISEMYHFLSVYALFDPDVNTRQDGFSQIVSPPAQEPEPWEKE